jgi:hypothetical protein
MRKAKESGRACIIGGGTRNDLGELDCEDAKATGC